MVLTTTKFWEMLPDENRTVRIACVTSLCLRGSFAVGWDQCTSWREQYNFSHVISRSNGSLNFYGLAFVRDVVAIRRFAKISSCWRLASFNIDGSLQLDADDLANHTSPAVPFHKTLCCHNLFQSTSLVSGDSQCNWRRPAMYPPVCDFGVSFPTEQ